MLRSRVFTNQVINKLLNFNNFVCKNVCLNDKGKHETLKQFVKRQFSRKKRDMRNIQMELKYIRKDRASHILLHNEPIGNEQENVRQQNNYIVLIIANQKKLE